MYRKILCPLCLIVSLTISSHSYAKAAPVIDVSEQANDTDSDHSNNMTDHPDPQQQPDHPAINRNNTPVSYSRKQPPIQQQLDLLQHQIKQLIDLNIPSKIDQLQRQLNRLRHAWKRQNNGGYSHAPHPVPTHPHSTVTAASAQKPSTATLHPSSYSHIPNEDALYQTALRHIVTHQLAQASQSLRAYLAKYTNGHYAANAHYWLGEIYLLKKNNSQAAQEFSTIVQRYAHSKKLPDARLKLAIAHAHLGQSQLARRELIAIQQDYPNTTVAQLAGVQLQEMQ